VYPALAKLANFHFLAKFGNIIRVPIEIVDLERKRKD
jgi:hypothetical protein